MKKQIFAVLALAVLIAACPAAARAAGVLKIITQETIINREAGAGATDSRVTRNALVTQIGEIKSGWYHIRLRNGEDGWIPDWTAEPAAQYAQPPAAFTPDMLPTTTKPLYGTIVADSVSWRITPYGGLTAKLDTTRGGSLPRGCTLKLTDKILHWFQAQISATEFVWVYDEALSPADKPVNVSDYDVPIATLSETAIQLDATGPVLSFNLSNPVPFIVKSNLSPAAVVYKLFGVSCNTLPQDWNAACNTDSQSHCTCTPGTDSLEGRLFMGERKLAGFYGRYDSNKFLIGARIIGLKPIRNITIDPGHGAEDPAPKGFADGTHSAKGVKEKDVVMQISKKLADDLKAAGFDTLLTREDNTNTMLDIYRRVEFSNDYGADLFISVHANGDENPALQGAEVYWYEPQSRPLAEYVTEEISTETGRKPGGVFYASFGVIRQTEVPAVLVETGYMTNPVEGARYSDPKFLDSCADGIARGIVRYVEYLNGTK